MATSCTFYCYRRKRAGAVTREVSGSGNVNDVVVNVAPQVSSGQATFTTATVTADVARRHYLDASSAASLGIDAGWYEKIATANFRKSDVREVTSW